jgi:hypothetical protein
MIQNMHQSQADQLIIYCRGTGPNPTLTHPLWTGVAVTFRKGREVGSQATTLDMNASHRDAAFCMLVDATELAKDMLVTSPTSSVIIYTANHQVIPWCLITDRHNNALACRKINEMLATILFNHPNTTVSIRWIPGSASFHPLKRILEVAINAATNANPAIPQAPPSIAALKQSVKLKSLEDWEKIWLADPCQNPAYHALHHPPLGQVLEFVARIENFARLVFCTTIRLLTEHVFTGKYNVRHHPHAPNPQLPMQPDPAPNSCAHHHPVPIVQRGP